MKAHPLNKILIGKQVADLRDVNGKAFGREILDVANRKGSGWVDYDWMNPATHDVDAKSTYCTKADDVVLACGIYR